MPILLLPQPKKKKKKKKKKKSGPSEWQPTPKIKGIHLFLKGPPPPGNLPLFCSLLWKGKLRALGETMDLSCFPGGKWLSPPPIPPQTKQIPEKKKREKPGGGAQKKGKLTPHL
eukprot:FR743335.1.p2 GENE.FR743335.1~~FR743335.1.p2  ORF type:complete len:114 (+),score=67.70 FR743335.1:723-1064(+)